MNIALHVQGLRKTYSNGVEALKGASFDVAEGDFFALLGPNGAGKSTLIAVITSLVRKTSGQVKVFGHDIDQDFSAAKACVGVVPQEFNFNLFETSEQILFNQAGYYGIPRHVAQPRIEHYLKRLSLWEKRKSPPIALSGGMKRRLLIARALIHEPRLLILDEPTAGVDIEIRRHLWDFLTELNETGVTIILTTHYLEEAEHLCRHIAIIDEGGIIEHTQMATLLEQLDRERLILYLTQPLLNGAPQVPGYTFWQQNLTTLEVEVPKEQGVTHLIVELNRLGIEVTSLRNKTNRLEELFLQLTQSN